MTERIAADRAGEIERLQADIQKDLAAYNAYVERHGSPADLIRAYLQEKSDDPDLTRTRGSSPG